MHVWNMLHAARWNIGRKKAILAPSHNFVGLYPRSWGTYRQSEKNLLNTDTSAICPHDMVNFGLLTAEIRWQVWGTPANFNGFQVLAVLLHGTLVWASAKLCGVEQRAPPIFGRATITLGIGSHSSFVILYCILQKYPVGTGYFCNLIDKQCYYGANKATASRAAVDQICNSFRSDNLLEDKRV